MTRYCLNLKLNSIGSSTSLTAAVLLIRDGRFSGANIRILEELELAGGALDGSGDAVHGYVTRGGRMLTEETYVCLWNVLDSIPTLATLDGDSLVANGRAFAMNGNGASGKLVPLNASQEFWHSWRSFQPDTERY